MNLAGLESQGENKLERRAAQSRIAVVQCGAGVSVVNVERTQRMQ